MSNTEWEEPGLEDLGADVGDDADIPDDPLLGAPSAGEIGLTGEGGEVGELDLDEDTGELGPL